MRWDLGGETDCNAGCPIKQHHGQTGRQTAGFFGRTIIVWNEIHGARINFIEQQARKGRQPRFGIAHRRRAVTVTRAKVALPVNQRVSQRKRLRQTNKRVVRGLVAVGMKASEDVTHDPGALDRPGGRAESHGVHGIQNSTLNRFETVANIGERTPLDHRNGVIQVGPLGVTRQGNRLIVFWGATGSGVVSRSTMGSRGRGSAGAV